MISIPIINASVHDGVLYFIAEKGPDRIIWYCITKVSDNGHWQHFSNESRVEVCHRARVPDLFPVWPGVTTSRHEHAVYVGQENQASTRSPVAVRLQDILAGMIADGPIQTAAEMPESEVQRAFRVLDEAEDREQPIVRVEAKKSKKKKQNKKPEPEPEPVRSSIIPRRIITKPKRGE